eukprot:2003672-Pleurochrysis_carterae.AAC.2
MFIPWNSFTIRNECASRATAAPAAIMNSIIEALVLQLTYNVKGPKNPAAAFYSPLCADKNDGWWGYATYKPLPANDTPESHPFLPSFTKGFWWSARRFFSTQAWAMTAIPPQKWPRSVPLASSASLLPMKAMQRLRRGKRRSRGAGCFGQSA